MKDEKQYCDWVIYNLFTYLNYEETPASLFVRAFDETKSCDKLVCDLKWVRDELEYKLGEEVIQRMNTGKETNSDERKAKEYLRKNVNWLQHQLWERLTWKNRIFYYTCEVPQEAMSSLGVILATSFGRRGALKECSERMAKLRRD